MSTPGPQRTPAQGQAFFSSRTTTRPRILELYAEREILLSDLDELLTEALEDIRSHRQVTRSKGLRQDLAWLVNYDDSPCIKLSTAYQRVILCQTQLFGLKKRRNNPTGSSPSKP